jgi:hypothetical protein
LNENDYKFEKIAVQMIYLEIHLIFYPLNILLKSKLVTDLI